jgi:hypothetical protein
MMGFPPAHAVRETPHVPGLPRALLARDRVTCHPVEAQKVAIEKTKNHMLVTAALHNPDLVAGGRDAISDFGDRQVNSIIGPQWKTKIPNLKKAAETVPPNLRNSTRMNVKLHKC